MRKKWHTVYIIIIIIFTLANYVWGYDQGYSQGKQIPQTYQGETAQQWNNHYSTVNSQYAELVRDNYIKSLTPTPTPEIQYQTQYVSQPAPTKTISKTISPCLDVNTGEVAPCMQLQ